MPEDMEKAVQLVEDGYSYQQAANSFDNIQKPPPDKIEHLHLLLIT